jgi:hypothetical protein
MLLAHYLITDPVAVIIMQYLTICEFLYLTTIATTKASILLLYHHLFPTRFMKLGIYIIAATVICWWIADILVLIFVCIPVEKAWHPEMHGHCMNKSQTWLGNAIPNITTDLLMLALPTYEAWRLQVRPSQKIAIIGIFLLGGW